MMARASSSVPKTPLPETYFAPATRADADTLDREVQAASASALLSTVLQAVGAVVAVLNPQRQIVAVNTDLLTFMGIEDPEQLLGSRPGEALGCIHAQDHPGGCGTSRTCSTCGAAIAILASQDTGCPQEQECYITTTTDGGHVVSIEFRVRAHPLRIDSSAFTVLLLRDICTEKRREALERAFFHDICNVLTALSGYSDLLYRTNDHETMRELAAHVKALSSRMVSEIHAQRDLLQVERGEYQITLDESSISDIFATLRETFAHHPATEKKQLDQQEPETPDVLVTDVTLLLRVLTNMVTNALEATDEGGNIRIWCDMSGQDAVFSVWNHQAIADDVALRIFERYYSTKEGTGHGLGTYSMKLIGEQYLAGRVEFTTNAQDGTTFTLTMPRRLQTRETKEGQIPQ